MQNSTLQIHVQSLDSHIDELPLYGQHQLGDSPFYLANLEVTPLAPGIEIIFAAGQIFQDVTLSLSYADPSLLLSTMLSGRCQFHIPDEPQYIFEQQAKQIWLGYHPLTKDIITCPAQEQLSLIAYSITPPTLAELIRDLPIPKNLYPLLDQPDTATIALPKLYLTPAITGIIQQIHTCSYSGAIRKLFLQGKALELLALYLTQLDERKTPFKQPSLKARDRDLIHQARDYLLSRKQNPPTLIELAHQVGINQEKLNRGFQELFGYTVFEYLRAARLEEAHQLIINSDLSIQEIAAAVGYNDPKHFARVFKAKFGCYPSSLRGNH